MTDTELLAPSAPGSLAGRHALVTGSSSGIGAAIARRLAGAGAHVLVHGRDPERVGSVVRGIRAVGGTASALVADLAGTPEETRAVAARALTLLDGRIDVLVNNAGVFPVGPTADLSDADVESLLTTNIRVPHQLVAAIAPAMAERGSGVVVNITSWMGRVGTPGTALYPATKAALEHLTRAWAAEYGPSGVRVVAVAPGNEHAAAILEQMTASAPAGRPGRPDEIALAVRWLVSDEASYVHGTTLDVDGGIVGARV
ncbi:SDR family NAD(P)-dependent oxidoreductase [Rathayibacter sp. AY1E2]|uniref:SDR family NAD(P)-dependent oxidoreductase n=1 Tax=Rathayibacter sp. AY1E2 TaxID=2080550 RepID=UPI000CE91923|nr:SDR family oxidoreductase [Rathayibacter sp. AY1E2]PPH52410.1 short-chain dehydrogenase [Rathayibacter sp. AY1E2]